MKKSTDELLNILKSKSDLNEYFEENRESLSTQSLTELLEETLRENGVSKSEAINNSSIEKHYGYQIFKGTKTPSRDKLIMLSFGMKASLDQTKQLLSKIKAAPLSPKEERDGVIIFGLLHKISITDINILLFERELPILE